MWNFQKSFRILIFTQGRDEIFKKNLVFPYHLIGSGEIFVKILVVFLYFNKEWQKILGTANAPSLSPLFGLVKR